MEFFGLLANNCNIIDEISFLPKINIVFLKLCDREFEPHIYV